MKTIETNRFTLRIIQKNDNTYLYNVLSNEQVIQTLNMKKHESIHDTDALIEDYLEGYKRKQKIPFVILNRETQEWIGVFLLKLDLYNEDSFEFTVYIDPKFWGQGVYSEILPYMIKETFEYIKVRNFRGYIMEGNIASEKVLRKNHFQLEKIFKVPNIEANIKSYLITQDSYKRTKESL